MKPADAPPGSLPLIGTRGRAGPRALRCGSDGPLLLPEGDDAGNLPLVPHLVHLRLEVLEVLLGEVGEAALLEQVFPYRFARPAFGDGLGLAIVPNDAVLNFVQGEDARFHRELAQLVR